MADPISTIVEVFQGFGVNWYTLGANCLNFVVVIFALKKFAVGPIQEMLDKRKAMIAEAVTNAEKVKQQLQSANEEKSKIIGAANTKATELVESAKSAAGQTKDNIINEAKRDAENILAKAKEGSIQERNQLLKQAKSEIANLVMGVTENVIGRTLTSDDQSRINSEASKEVSNA